MHRVPRRSLRRYEVSPFVEWSNFVTALVVSGSGAITNDATYALEVAFMIHDDFRIADGLSEFIKHLAGKHSVRSQSQYEAFSIEVCPCYDRGRKLFMLVVRRSNEPALCCSHRIFACWDMKLEASIVVCDDG